LTGTNGTVDVALPVEPLAPGAALEGLGPGGPPAPDPAPVVEEPVDPAAPGAVLEEDPPVDPPTPDPAFSWAVAV